MERLTTAEKQDPVTIMQVGTQTDIKEGNERLLELLPNTSVLKPSTARDPQTISFGMP